MAARSELTRPVLQIKGSAQLDICRIECRDRVIPHPWVASSDWSSAMPWTQRTLQLAARRRGFHLITREVLEALPELGELKRWHPAFVHPAHLGLALDQRKRRLRRAARSGILAVGNRSLRTSRTGTPAKVPTTCRPT